MDKLTVSINRDKCQGYGKCAQHAPETFSLDADNKVVLGDPEATEDSKMLVRAAKSCPYRVITVSDDNGQIFPPVKKTAEA
jgi:ferredoxin